jgi:tetratricopeptide (TPR) repeat protein
LNNKGVILGFKKRDFNNTLACFDKAISINPHYKEAKINREGLMGSMGNNRKSVEESLEAGVPAQMAFYTKANTFYSNNQSKEAIQFYDQCLAITSENIYFISALRSKAYSLFQLVKYEEALDSFEKAAEIDPSFQSAKDMMTKYVLASGKYVNTRIIILFIMRIIYFKFQLRNQSPEKDS